MTARTSATQHEVVTVESLILYAHRRFDALGLNVSASKVSTTVRKALRQSGPTWARLVIDKLIEEHTRSDTFEPWVTVGLHYADPTGNAAAGNIDHNKKKGPAPTGPQSNQ